MDPTHRKRLWDLAEFLKTIPEHRFDMESWVSEPFLDITEVEEINLKSPSCDTSACALGWATTLFPAELAFIKEEDTEAWEVTHLPTGATAFRAAEQFFGLSRDESEELFGGVVATPEEKAAQIHQFIGD